MCLEPKGLLSVVNTVQGTIGGGSWRTLCSVVVLGAPGAGRRAPRSIAVGTSIQHVSREFVGGVYLEIILFVCMQSNEGLSELTLEQEYGITTISG